MTRRKDRSMLDIIMVAALLAASAAAMGAGAARAADIGRSVVMARTLQPTAQCLARDCAAPDARRLRLRTWRAVPGAATAEEFDV
jgi:hypothetical protein